MNRADCKAESSTRCVHAEPARYAVTNMHCIHGLPDIARIECRLSFRSERYMFVWEERAVEESSLGNMHRICKKTDLATIDFNAGTRYLLLEAGGYLIAATCLASAENQPDMSCFP